MLETIARLPATGAVLLDPSGRPWPVDVAVATQRVFADATDEPPAAVVVLELLGDTGLPVPGKAQLESPDGGLSDVEVLFAKPVGNGRAFYVAVAAGYATPLA